MTEPGLDEIREYYNKKSDNLIKTIRNPRQMKIIEFVHKHADMVRNKKVLSIGCGIGAIEDDMAALPSIVTGIDISDVMIAYAKAHYRGEYICAPFESHDFKGARFGAVCFFDAIEHFRGSQLTPVLHKTDALLDAGGHILMNVPQEEVSVDWHAHHKEWLQIVDNPINIASVLEILNRKGNYELIYREKYDLFHLYIIRKALPGKV